METTKGKTMDKHEHYSFLIDVSDFFLSMDMPEWAKRIGDFADEYLSETA